MSIANEITNYANGLSDAYDAVNDMQGIIPTDKNMNNLDSAIRTIPQSTGPTYTAGDGIDITNDVISATNTGKARILTTDDYNYSPQGTPPYTYVNMHWLDPGVYILPHGLSAKFGNSIGGMVNPSIWLVTDAWYVGSASDRRMVYQFTYNSTTDGGIRYAYGPKDSTVSSQAYSQIFHYGTLEDSLTSNNNYKSLTAKQGKVLKDLIDSLVVKNAGAPTTSTTGTVGQLYEDTTNGKLYICTDATNPYVWVEVGAGGATYTAGNGINIDANNEISIDDTVVAEVSDLPSTMTGASASTAGASGLVPAPAAGDNTKFLAGDGTWATPAGGSPTTFYVNVDIFDTTSGDAYFYKDSSLTTAATFLEIYTAASTNGAILLYHDSGHDSDNQYVVTTFSYDPYWNTYKFGVVSEITRGGTGVPSIVFFSGAGSYTHSGKYRYYSERPLTAGNNISINLSSGIISATDTTYSDFTGATSSVAGTSGLVPAPTTSDVSKFLKGDGTWGTPASGSTVTLFAYDSMGDLYDASSNYATAQDVLTALGNGKVIVGDIIDYPDSAYEIVSSDSDSYFVAVSRHANGSPEFVTLHYDSTSPTAPMGAWTRNAYIPQQKLTAGTNISISGATISATDTTYSNFTGATSSVAGANGLVPAPAAGDEGKALHGDGTWKDTTAKLVEMSYGESSAWAKFIAAYNAGSIVYCRASSNSNPASGSQTRKAFMAYVNNATSPTSVEFQYVRSVSSKSSSQPVDQVFVYTLTNSNGGTWSVATRDMAPKLAAGTNTSVSYGSGTYTINANNFVTLTGLTIGLLDLDGQTLTTTNAESTAILDSITNGKNIILPISSGDGGGVYIENCILSTVSDSTSGDTFFSFLFKGVPYYAVMSSKNVWAIHQATTTNSYSTYEKFTGDTWIDGKKIYKKTINFGALPNNTPKSVAHNISNLGYVVKHEGYCQDSSGNRLPIPIVGSSPASILITDTDITIVTNSDRTAFTTCYVTLYYTKSS